LISQVADKWPGEDQTIGILPTMESLGYKVVLCEGMPSEEIIEAVEQLVQRGSQCHWRPTRENPTVCYLEGGRECETFLHHEAKLSDIVEASLRIPYDNTIRQHSRIVRFVPNTAPPQVQRAHPTADGAVSIFRPLRDPIGPENGMFKVFPCSHHLSKEEVLRSGTPATEIRLRPDQILVALGSLWLETSQTGDGPWLVWQGYSCRPMGLDIFSEETLDFMKLP
jgi:hypothetical protein